MSENLFFRINLEFNRHADLIRNLDGGHRYCVFTNPGSDAAVEFEVWQTVNDRAGKSSVFDGDFSTAFFRTPDLAASFLRRTKQAMVASVLEVRDGPEEEKPANGRVYDLYAVSVMSMPGLGQAAGGGRTFS